MSFSSREPSALGSQKTILVAGLGVTGRAVARVLLRLGCDVTAAETAIDYESSDVTELLAQGMGLVETDLDLKNTEQWLQKSEITLVVASPGWPPSTPLLQAAAAANIPIWSEAELAWRLRKPENPPWLVVTGTNGKTTTVRMLKSILESAGLATQAVGNIGRPLIDAALDADLEMLAVELSSFQLHYTQTVAPLASAVLNIAPDHIDWHGSFDAYVAAKARAYSNTEVACLYSVSDERTEEILRQASVASGARAIGITLDIPSLGMLGIVEDRLYDRGFAPDRRTHAQELASLADLSADSGHAPPSPTLVIDALFAAGMALAAGAPPSAIAQGLRSFATDTANSRHRGEEVAAIDGVRFINNSKATNPHAARSALRGLTPGSTVWILGGQTKGADLEELIQQATPLLRAAVLIGVDRELISELFHRHAPDLPVIEIHPGQTGDVMGAENLAAETNSPPAIMERAVVAAVSVSKPGDTVLLAPACASLDQFASFEERGTAFIAAVSKLEAEEGGGN